MYCSRCGKEIEEGTGYCPYCGEPIGTGQKFKKTAEEAFKRVDEDISGSFEEMGDTFTGNNNGNAPQGTVPRHLRDDRGLAAYILLTIITCGIYGYYFIYKIAQDTNTACDGDGDNTPGLGAYILLSIITCGFYSLWWDYKIANRLSFNAPRYGIRLEGNGTTVLVWYLIGCVTCGIGSFVAVYIIIRNANRLFAAYNRYYGV